MINLIVVRLQFQGQAWQLLFAWLVEKLSLNFIQKPFEVSTVLWTHIVNCVTIMQIRLRGIAAAVRGIKISDYDFALHPFE